MYILVIGIVTAIVVLWKIEKHPYWTAIIKSFLIGVGIFLSNIVSKYQSEIPILFEDIKKALLFGLLISIVLLPFMVFNVKLHQILKKDLDNPK